MEIRFPWGDAPDPIAGAAVPPDRDRPPKPPGRRPAAALRAMVREAGSGDMGDGPVQGGWLYHHLAISGPAGQVAAFAAAARGAGVVPWQLDFAALEEDVFNIAASQPPGLRRLTLEGCRILARQFRERVEARQARAAARVGQSRACPFDLQSLLPVPAALLRLGPLHPAALAWLSAHWGMTDRLRRVEERPLPGLGRRLPGGHAAIGYGFFTAGATPDAAMARIGGDWPALRLVLRPRPAD